MDYLFYCRDQPDALPVLERLTEAHWDFMDGYADRLLVRGPTLDADGEAHTGSLHIVRLGGAEEAATFAYQEPFYRGGAYREVIIHRWRDRCGRTMRDFQPRGEEPLFLVLGHAAPGSEPPRELSPPHLAGLAIYGWTEALDGARWTGFAAILQQSALAVVDALLEDLPPVTSVETHRWCVGGRR